MGTRGSQGTVALSVVIPTFNRASELGNAIRSVLQQTVRVDEVVVVDDGSTDETRSVVRGFPPSVRYHYQENQGTGVARNRGVAEASGDVIAFLDADDYWSPHKLDAQLRVLEALPDVGWVATNLLVVDSHGSPVKGRQGLERAVPVFRDQGCGMEQWLATALARTRIPLHEGDVDVFFGDLSRLLLYGNFIFPSTVVLRRELARDVGPFEPEFRRAQDNDYFLRVAELSPGAIITEPLVRYRMGAADQATRSSNTLELIEVAMESIARARQRRPTLGEADLAAYNRGRELLFRRKAYALLSDFQREEARDALRDLRDLTGRLGPLSLVMLMLSYLPEGVLRLLRRLKRSTTRIG